MVTRSFVRGEVQLANALRELGRGPPTKDIDAAANIALQPMLDSTRALMEANRNFYGKYDPDFFPQPKTPRPGGFVDRGLNIRANKVSPTQRRYKLGATTNRARKLMHLLEFGTSPHFEPHFHGGWMHPGAAPNPALVPSFEQFKGYALSTFGREIVDRIIARARALGMRTSRR